MKILRFLLSLYWLIAPILLSQQNDNQKLSGPYIRWKPPGKTPEIFAPGIVSQEGIQSKLHITPDGSEIIYQSMILIPGQENTPSDRHISFVSIKMVNGIWGTPAVLSFSRDFINDEPSLSPDGKKLFFVSNRPKEGKTDAEKMPDIWMVNKIGGEWSEPKNIGTPVNTDGVEVQPFYSIDDKLYFGRKDGIYYSQFEAGKYHEPVKLDENIYRAPVRGICISPDNKTLIVHSNKLGGFGAWDLFVSFKNKAGKWSELINMGNAINTENSESSATFSPDGKYLFYTRGDDIYWVSVKIVEDMRPKK